ncbi:MAG: cobalamin B12-binding domain-containing protein [Candidatus Hydrothermia bacterium]|jgi:methylmalonyl-CoA mutase C-terminal domain/subunit|nr:cobalamin B12-binding domain-containing protein [Candidatus Hydrothermia bacterium]
MNKPIKVLIGKVGLDGHDRGAKVLARALRDAGMEVVYSGLHRTAEEIVQMAIDEDVDVIGISILSGAHMTYFPKILKLMKENGLEDVLLIGGGIIPEEDAIELEKMGVSKIFGPGTPLEEIINYIKNWYEKKKLASVR